MSARKRRYHKIAEGDKFETEAFEFLNEAKEFDSKSKKPSADDESDVELAVSDEEEANEEDNLLDDNDRLDDDDAPDSVDFATSKITVMQQFRQAMEQIESEKQKKKEKRKKLDTQYKDQKSQKLTDLSKSKLPEDLLESLDSEIPKKKKKQSVNRLKKKEKKREEEDEDEAVEEVLQDEVHRLSPDTGLNYIPLSGRIDRASGIEVVKLGEEKKKLKSAAESAAEFLKNRLYGAHIPRETTKQKMAKEEKRKARFR